MGLIPGVLGYFAYKYEVRSEAWWTCVELTRKQKLTYMQGKFELRGKRRGDTISEW